MAGRPNVMEGKGCEAIDAADGVIDGND